MSMAKLKAGISKISANQNFQFDPWLVTATLALMVFGLVMVASASIVVSQTQFHSSFHFLIKQSIYMMLGLLAVSIVIRIETTLIQKIAPYFLLLTFLLLILVLVPGIGREVNGSTRWIGVGPIGFQVSELAKLFAILYMADYLARRNQEVKTQVSGFLKPMILLGVMALLLLKEPDFGAATVIMATALAMMFLAGAKFWQFLVLLGSVASALAALAISSPYRLARLTTFLNPWSHEYASGYQLTQSLIAFGRGGWFGVGLGDSIQKLFYLPEAHTDFLFAVLAEELGMAGVLAVIALFGIIVWRALVIARRAHERNNLFGAFLGYGLGLWMAMQAMINIGVNSGLLPTKGLTLPLMSYGGSSLIVMLTLIGLLIRIDYELRSSE